MVRVAVYLSEWVEYGFDRVCVVTGHAGACRVMNWWVNTRWGRWLMDNQKGEPC